MNSPQAVVHSYPTAQQAALLGAALLPGEAGLAAWRSWRASANIDQLDPGSFRVLPLLYHNLAQQGVVDPWLDRCKGVYRQTWYKNQWVFHQMTTLLSALNAAGIKTLLLKGAPLALLYYRDQGLRMINDSDILVPTAQVKSAIDLLQTHGWRPKSTLRRLFSREHLMLRHAHGFVNQNGREFDLHWYTLAQNCAPGMDEMLWQASVPLTVNGMETRTLNTTDHLLHICAHGMQRPHAYSSMQWIPDALMLLRNPATAIDWERLIQQTQRRALNIRLTQALQYLHQRLNAPIPTDILQQLARLPVQKFEKREAQTLQPTAEGWRVLWSIWAGRQRHQWILQQAGMTQSTVNLFQYFQYIFDLDHPWQVPFRLGQAVLRRMIG